MKHVPFFVILFRRFFLRYGKIHLNNLCQKVFKKCFLFFLNFFPNNLAFLTTIQWHLLKLKNYCFQGEKDTIIIKIWSLISEIWKTWFRASKMDIIGFRQNLVKIKFSHLWFHDIWREFHYHFSLAKTDEVIFGLSRLPVITQKIFQVEINPNDIK